MIVLLEEDHNGFLECCASDPYVGIRITTALSVYGIHDSRNRFWSQVVDRQTTAAIGQVHGKIFVAARDQADYDELSFFLQSGGNAVELSEAASQRLHLSGNRHSHTRMRFEGKAPILSNGVEPALSPGEVLPVLEAVSPFATAALRDAWYAYTSHLLRHELGFYAVQRREGQAVSVGSILGFAGRFALIGDIATLHSHRGQGAASRVVAYLTWLCLQRGWTPLLTCENQRLLSWYQSLGFAPHNSGVTITPS